jgi:integration host factor subunit beta
VTKAELIHEVAESSSLNLSDASEVVETILSGIVEALDSGDKVEVRGFGSFRSRTRKARQGRNPKSGESVSVPAKRVAYFKPGKALNELINS